jgi:hypothetical protein
MKQNPYAIRFCYSLVNTIRCPGEDLHEDKFSHKTVLVKLDIKSLSHWDVLHFMEATGIRSIFGKNMC